MKEFAVDVNDFSYFVAVLLSLIDSTKMGAYFTLGKDSKRHFLARLFSFNF